VEVEPPPIPNWDLPPEPPSWINSRWEQAASRTGSQRRAAASTPAATRDDRQRSRAFSATVVVTALAVVFLAVAGVMFLLRSSPKAASSATTAPRAAVSHDTVTPAETAHMLTATRGAVAATTAARTNLDSLAVFPTPDKVAAVMNPYVSSLQHYETVLMGTDTPAAARTTALSTLILVTQDVQFLGTVNGLAPVKLGTYLEDFGTNASQLLRTLSTFERELGASTA
jgi:hypothetical protein